MFKPRRWGAVTPCAGAILKHYSGGKTLRGAEVGVCRAHTSCILLKRLPRLVLALADNWEVENEGPSGPEIERQAMENLSQFDGRWVLAKMDSTKAADEFPDRYFDFVLIDATHHLPKCYEDMAAWWPKVKGKMFCHDIGRDEWDVDEAVEQFFRVADDCKAVQKHPEYNMAVFHKETEC